MNGALLPCLRSRMQELQKSFNAKNGDFDMNDIKKALLPMKTRLFFQKAKQRDLCLY